MDLILNSKFFAELTLAQLGSQAAQWGYDGIDLVVRPGHRIDLGNVNTALVRAVRHWEGMGLSCPLVSVPVDFNDPTRPEAERLFAACAAAGVLYIKLGYWYFVEGQDYWSQLDQARQALEGFAHLADRYGVKACYHTHSGACIGSNCAGLMQLLRGVDPAQVGAYPDFGHMALDGEDLAMGLAMVRQYLAVVGIKDGCHTRRETGGTPPHVPIFTHLGAGSVDWERGLGLLSAMGYDGPLSVHTEYQFDEEIIRQVGYAGHKPAALETWARADGALLKGILHRLEQTKSGETSNE